MVVTESNTNQFKLYCVEFKRQQDALQLIQQLNQMVKAVQRHRGMSMAMLAGSDLFKVEFGVLQRQVERRLASLEVFAACTAGILSVRDQECLHSAWHTIRADWQDDDVIDNFELHSHFIEQLQSMVTRLSKTLERPASLVVGADEGREASDGEGSAPHVVMRIELLNFAATQLPSMVEHIAKIRGLSTYAASGASCDYHHKQKLRYAMSCAQSLNQKMQSQAEGMEARQGKIRALSSIKTYNIKLTYLMNTVDLNVLSGQAIDTNSHKLFILATEIVDMYLTVVDELMAQIKQWHEEDLESWLNGTAV